MDVWQNVMGHFESQEAICVFEKLWKLRMFPDMNRLDAFWAVITNARRTPMPEVEFEILPDSEPFVHGVDKLVDMGLPRTTAIEVLRDAHGSWEMSMRILGWD